MNSTGGLNGWTALHEACEHGHTKVVQLLLDQAVNIEILTHRRESALEKAASHGAFEIVRLLLNVTNANINGQNDRGETALMLAVKGSSKDTV